MAWPDGARVRHSRGGCRRGAWVVGVSASLKAWPLLAVPVYAWRRKWSAVAISLGVATLLWLPALLTDLSAYPVNRPPNIYDGPFLRLKRRMERPGSGFAAGDAERRLGYRLDRPVGAAIAHAERGADRH